MHEFFFAVWFYSISRNIDRHQCRQTTLFERSVFLLVQHRYKVVVGIDYLFSSSRSSHFQLFYRYKFNLMQSNGLPSRKFLKQRGFKSGIFVKNNGKQHKCDRHYILEHITSNSNHFSVHHRNCWQYSDPNCSL